MTPWIANQARQVENTQIRMDADRQALELAAARNEAARAERAAEKLRDENTRLLQEREENTRLLQEVADSRNTAEAL